jgi:Rod binding domain-containing protein
VSVDALSSLPVVPDTALPADVRSGSTEDKQTYQAALAFERQLLTQLMQSMTYTATDDSDSSSDDDSGDDELTSGSDAATSTYQQMMPEQMANAVINGGGTGLAENLYHALREGQS